MITCACGHTSPDFPAWAAHRKQNQPPAYKPRVVLGTPIAPEKLQAMIDARNARERHNALHKVVAW